jgi:hypothetical protein
MLAAGAAAADGFDRASAMATAASSGKGGDTELWPTVEEEAWDLIAFLFCF